MEPLVNILAQRSSGVLLPVFSLPSPGGIGDLGPGARRFVDFLEAAGQSWWQFLPLGPTAADLGESPYMSPSALAGNPLLVSPKKGEFRAKSDDFRYTFPANSITILRWK